jgi:prolyl-tRNA synthetase
MGDENMQKAKQIGRDLEISGVSVILDDRMGRKDGFGQKVRDCELWGIPNRIIISSKTREL